VTVEVVLSQQSVSATVDISLVCSTELTVTAHPYPAYPGSTQYITTSLAPMADSGVHQRAVLDTSLWFTDQSYRDVTTAPAIQYALQPQEADTIVALDGTQGVVTNVD
jgi:hypothetical protein